MFNLSGDFEIKDEYSKNLISVLLTRETVRVNNKGEESALGMHCFLHIFDGKHLAQGFGEVIGDLVRKKWLRRVDVEVSASKRRGTDDVGSLCHCCGWELGRRRI